MSEKKNNIRFGQRLTRAVAYGMALTPLWLMGFGALASLGVIAVADVPFLAILFGFSCPLGIEISKGMVD